MHDNLKKQIIFFFVLPAIAIPLFTGLMLIPGIPLWIKPTIALILLTIWVIAGKRQVRELSRSYENISKALSDLNAGKPVSTESSSDLQLFNPIQIALAETSKRMRKQQEELEEERVQRLRSVIDGQDQERHRLSRELHDGMGQSLIAIKLQLENAGELSHSQMRASVDVAKGMLDQTIDEVRRVTNALMPAALNEFGLITALRTRCEEMASMAGLKVNFENHGSIDRLDAKSKTYLYRIAQEAITNTIKHARATELTLRLNRNGNEVCLLIQDNGKGFIFDPSSFAHRNGLQNIRERVTLLDGSFELKTRPNTGTTLKITVPYKTGNGKHTNHSGR